MSNRKILLGAGIVFALYGLFCLWVYTLLGQAATLPEAQLLKLIGEECLIGGLVLIFLLVLERIWWKILIPDVTHPEGGNGEEGRD